MDIAGLLRRARYDAGLTQRALAARVGVSHCSLSRYEAGVCLPSLSMVERLLTGCGKDAQWTLVRRHADLDAELDRQAALPLVERLHSVDLLTGFFVQTLAKADVLIGGAWAASLHGIPHEGKHGRVWYAGSEAGIAALAAVLRARIALLYVDGELSSPVIRPATLQANPEAEWLLRLAGPFSTTVVPPGAAWPAEVRLDGPEGPLRVVPAHELTPDDGVLPAVLQRWSIRAAERAGAP